ncbi:hypothetical protein DICSQDRAFT_80562 [Dichomitus squalens LYAD-421 SS1]|uniref:uncharacterized protein n=1 Tax=Dichomitus squalens (strain LYAD-421) TaxID=732165 RepID=UPI0004410D57|nr:uncharacterized protein DICSQDRAFT_80562 [Dichomitus squalens LYAD-421 SS1]EJF64833.1 hypothetical protein DICSQDRAFT_80562 [Dichomitus squalens LYAD-421 SS1]
MAYQGQTDIVSGEQYRYALTNFRIAHEKVEEQRVQLQEQEKQVALLRARIALLEGTNQNSHLGVSKLGGNSVDDFSIKNAASGLERQINRWAADVTRAPPVPFNTIRQAALTDVFDDDPPELGPNAPNATGIQIQSLLRHAVSKTIAEGIVNCLIVTDSPEANIQLTRIHEHIFSRDATVAAVWRRQTFTAAVESCSEDMSRFFLSEHMPNLTKILGLDTNAKGTAASGIYLVLEAAYEFSRMLHGAPSSSGGSVDAFYRAFVPDVAITMNPRQIELVKRCHKTERGELDRVGATVFPGLVKVSRGPQGPNGVSTEDVQTVVRRAQVICECALMGTGVVSPGVGMGPGVMGVSPPPSAPPSVSPQPYAHPHGGY